MEVKLNTIIEEPHLDKNGDATATVLKKIPPGSSRGLRTDNAVT